MKITMDANPKEIAEFLIEFANASHKSYQVAEERIGNILMSGLAKLGKKEENITNEEVPIGGNFH